MDKKLKYEEVKRNITLLSDVEDIEPYHITLPEPPPIELITNYGLPKEEQFFQRERVPRKIWELTAAVNSDKMTREEAFAECKKDAELNSFIQEQWRKREQGEWVYVYGKPMYLTGTYWWYLNYYILDTGRYPDFRTTDLDEFQWWKFCVEDNPAVYGGINFTRRRVGKCFGINTPIRMYDGSVKMVQNVIEGDIVMGNDSTPRNVHGVTVGSEQMYRIVPKKGDAFCCNESHILSLVYTGNRNNGQWKKGGVVNITVREYLGLSNGVKNHLCLYRNGWGNNYQENEHYIPPYILGVYLGDGCKTFGHITSVDKEIIDELIVFCNSKNLKIEPNDISYRICRKETTSAKSLSIIDNGELMFFSSVQEMNHHFGFGYDSRKHLRKKFIEKYSLKFTYENSQNPYREELKKLGVMPNKHIPKCYMIDSVKNRMDLLAGLLDTDGHLQVRERRGSGTGKCNIYTYEITQKRENLALDILDLARSLGFSANIKSKIATMKRHGKSDYKCKVYRVLISGDLTTIPCRIKRKKVAIQEKRNSALSTGISVEDIGRGDYYGFAVDSNNLFLLADGTVVHNTYKAGCIQLEYITRTENAKTGIQSKSEPDAGEFFRKAIVYQFKRLPFFFKPCYEKVGKMKKEVALIDDDNAKSFESFMDFQSSTDTAYDGQKVHRYVLDECGKMQNPVDPIKIWDKVKPCLEDESLIIGRALLTTTVEDMEKGGGDKFKHIWNTSSRIPKDEKVNELGETESGLVPYFTSGYKNRFFNKYGFPIVGKPTTEEMLWRKNVKKDKNYMYGGKEYIDIKIASAKNAKDRQNQIRKYAPTIRDSFRYSNQQCLFDIEVINDRLTHFFGNAGSIYPRNFPMTFGYFEWVKGKEFKEAVFIPTDEKSARCHIRYMPPPDQRNRWGIKNGKQVPANTTRFNAGADPFKLKTEQVIHRDRMSDGAGHVYALLDPSVDNLGKPREEWVTDNFVLEYLFRPETPDLFAEDMAMICVFYGCKIFPENNINIIDKCFREWGLEEYLQFQQRATNRNNMVVFKEDKTIAGAYNIDALKPTLIRHGINYIREKGMYCPFPRTLEQFRDVSYDTFSHYDAAVSGLFTLTGVFDAPVKKESQNKVNFGRDVPLPQLRSYK